jgi:hypothetical protein
MSPKGLAVFRHGNCEQIDERHQSLDVPRQGGERMNRIFAIAAAVLAMCAGQSPMVYGQTRSPSSQSQEREIAPGTQMVQVVEGKVSAVRGRWIVFANGTQVAVPDNVAHLEMKPGAVVRAMYEEREGQKFATSIELRGHGADQQ